MEKDCVAEILDFHRFLVDWLSGTLANNDREFARCAEALAQDFIIVGLSGSATGRAALLGQLKGVHGGCAGSKPPFAIRIENPGLLHQWDDHALLTYEEWQEGAPGAGQATGRRSTVLFARTPSAPGGVAWLHLHETWIVGHLP